ncbi:MAG TPA: HEAT repeat domain-containing protein [Candidatus Acidoferrum sp.]|nr:HEAT repeat domain-containing protein [Candidatus Acidoferrum sp.]
MAQPSKVGPAFLTIFALPFLGGGLFFIYGLLTSSPNFHASSLATGLFVASFFVLVGAGLIFAAIKGYSLLKKQAGLQEANPLSPWLWRADWASRRAEGANKKGFIGAWIAAAFCTLITAPFMLGMIPDLLRKSDPGVFIVLGFNLFSAILLVNAIRATIRHERFGNSYFEFDPLPLSPGRRMTGRIQLRFETQATHGIDLRLSCVRRIVTGSGKNQTTSKVALWQADKNVPSSSLEPGPLGRAIPVEFDIPADAVITDQTNPSDQILWLLHAKADVPGVDYSDDFELPVFQTADSAQPAAESSAETSLGSSTSNFGFATARSVDADSGAVQQPERTKVIVSMHDGGTEFYFPPLRTPTRALMLLVVSLVFSGAVYALLHSNVPVLFTSLFTLGDLLVIFGFFHVTFGSARIGLGNGEILSRRGILGLGKTRRFPVSEVDSIVPVGSVQQGGNTDDNSIYSIQLHTKSGQKITLADEISSRQEARWVVSQLETLAGLKLDTHVEVSLPLGVPTQPVQLRTGRPNVRVQTTGSSWVAFAVFGATVLAMFAWQMKWNGGARSVRANSSRPSSRTAAASRPKPVPPRVFSGPLTDADVTRVLSLPPQAQAEELFERTIGRDERALEVFGQQFDGWIGRINQSDRMSQLLQRAQFSKDLRVRLAHVDMSLALQGFHENRQAADSLMNRADRDAQYRAWAVFYLGMLAGRGVDYDRIHQVLLSYARNDKDPTVRQWAVEGLRFLSKDEVLDELFTSFAEDPSMKVRDRAGCNIADCGIFTRKQRMRMVPKLIELAADTKASAQIRSWSFLALQEITDANVPADPLAWNRWYADHGAEKMGEFERLEWWQVRGHE